jgi:hypothetical protein
MSGIIDEKGIQWEHCNECTKFTKLDNLGYEPPTRKYKYGRDLCIDCTNKLSQYKMKK